LSLQIPDGEGKLLGSGRRHGLMVMMLVVVMPGADAGGWLWPWWCCRGSGWMMKIPCFNVMCVMCVM
jgi:hypothetical protein